MSLPINTSVHDVRVTLVKRHCHAGRAFSTCGDVDAHSDIALVVVAVILRLAVGFVQKMIGITIGRRCESTTVDLVAEGIDCIDGSVSWLAYAELVLPRKD